MNPLPELRKVYGSLRVEAGLVVEDVRIPAGAADAPAGTTLRPATRGKSVILMGG
ncbi:MULTISPECIES: hypothetical protein [unclassified Methanoculleus]|uniref:hypothetical protein n=1 Tax=unclassified Methanoculleus TaxID=2619537 RepID=UPI0025E035E7|nr:MULTISPECIES: hypothetical protein [unclassified Methanoculleus]